MAIKGDFVGEDRIGKYEGVDRTEPIDILRREQVPATVDAALAPSVRFRFTHKPEYDAWLQRQLAQAPPLSDERWHKAAKIIASTPRRHDLARTCRPGALRDG